MTFGTVTVHYAE